MWWLYYSSEDLYPSWGHLWRHSSCTFVMCVAFRVPQGTCLQKGSPGKQLRAHSCCLVTVGGRDERSDSRAVALCPVGSQVVFNCGLMTEILPFSIIFIHYLTRMRSPSRYFPLVCNGPWLFRLWCFGWLLMLYGIVKFYWVKSTKSGLT